MPLDTNIYSNIGQPSQAVGRLASIFDPTVIQARQLKEAQTQQEQGNIARANKLQQLLGSAQTADPGAMSQTLAQSGFADEALKYQGLAEAQRQRQEAEVARRADTTRKAFGQIAALGGDSNAVRKTLSQLPWMRPEQIEEAATAADMIAPESRQSHFLGLADPQYLARTQEAERARIERGEQNAARLRESAAKLPEGMRANPQTGQPEWIPGYLEAKERIARAGATAGGVPMTILQTESGTLQVPTRGGGPAVPVIDPTTGKQAKPQPAGGGQKIGAEVQRQIGGVIQFDRDMDALKEEMKDFNPRSADATNMVKRARIQSIAKQAQLSAKEAAALGALTGPDMALLEGIQADPTSLRAMALGKEGLLAQIEQAKAGNRRRVESIGDQYGPAALENFPVTLRPQKKVTQGAPATGGFKYLGKE